MNQRAGNNVNSNYQLQVTANVFPSSQILVTLMMKAILSSETSFLRRVIICPKRAETTKIGDNNLSSITLASNNNEYSVIQTY
jgi:hypothetical protein